jgi:hypothetical protein
VVNIEQFVKEMQENINKMTSIDPSSEEFTKLQEKNGQAFSKIIGAVNKESNIPKQCLHPKKEDCSGDIIFAHSIQKAKLSQIADNGFVIRFEPSMNKGLIPKGIDSASTFKGFCQKHDQIFSEIEDKEYEGTDYQKFLYFYRTYCKYFYDELTAINDAKIWCSFVPDKNLEEYEKHKERNFERFTKAKEKADQLLSSETYTITNKEMTLDKDYNIINSSMIWLYTDFEGNKIDGPDFKFFTFNIFTSDNKTHILFSYFSDYADTFSFIDTQLLEKGLEEQKRILNLLIAFEPSNLAYKKENFELWGDEAKDNFMTLTTDEFHINGNHFLEQIKFNFFNEVAQ